jgi:diguanylate cyclase (GGDEF)-like protein
MSSCVRSYDAIGRYGGEEFLVVLPGCDTASGVCRAERLRATIFSKPFDTSEGRITVTCSLGVASTANGSYQDVDGLMRAADAALYRAKNLGRNRVES